MHCKHELDKNYFKMKFGKREEFVHRFSSCYIRTEGRTEMLKLIGEISQTFVANVTKNDK
jgi:hypothetical protein